ncbi:hypothetical protein Dimus_032823 [Dionaea muscipula]
MHESSWRVIPRYYARVVIGFTLLNECSRPRTIARIHLYEPLGCVREEAARLHWKWTQSCTETACRVEGHCTARLHRSSRSSGVVRRWAIAHRCRCSPRRGCPLACMMVLLGELSLLDEDAATHPRCSCSLDAATLLICSKRAGAPRWLWGLLGRGIESEHTISIFA